LKELQLSAARQKSVSSQKNTLLKHQDNQKDWIMKLIIPIINKALHIDDAN